MAKFVQALRGFTESDIFKCDVCGLIPPEGVEHLKVHFTTTLFSCTEPSCKFSGVEWKNFFKHLEETEGLHMFQYRCFSCEYYGVDFTGYLVHLQVHHRDKVKKTKRSVFQRRQRDMYSRLPESARPQNVDPFVEEYANEGLICKVCDENVMRESKTGHLAVHLQNTSFKCTNCISEWSNYEFYLAHLCGNPLIKHLFACFCQLCRLSFNHPETYLGHLRFHHGRSAKMYTHKSTKGHATCVACNIKFANAHQFLFHLKVKHHTDSSFYCLVCFDSIKDYTGVADHIALHKLPKINNFGIGCLCNICGTNFTDYVTFLAHLGDHTKGSLPSRSEQEEQPVFLCKNVTWNLRNFPHLNIQFKDDTGSCDASFRETEKLEKHVKQHIWGAETNVDNTNLLQSNGPYNQTGTSGQVDFEAPEVLDQILNDYHGSPGPTSVSNACDVLQVSTNDDEAHLIKSVCSSDDSQLQLPSKRMKQELLKLTEENVSKKPETVGQPRIKIYVCRVCKRKFIQKHFLEAHMVKVDH